MTRNGKIDRRTLLRLLAGTVGVAAMAVAPEVFAQQRPKPPPKLPPKLRLVVLDPGHGGVDPGAIGRTGTYEKDVALATAREVARQGQDLGFIASTFHLYRLDQPGAASGRP